MSGGDFGEHAAAQKRESREFMQLARAVGFDGEGTGGFGPYE